MANLVGIHLGVTNSSVSVINDVGVPTIVRSILGEKITPSVVSFIADNAVNVGEVARRTLGVDPNTFARFQRQMGTSISYSAFGKEYTPTTLSSLVLKKLKDEAEFAIGPIDGAIVTVPANFANEAREATMEAGKLAGLDIEHIINEPTAAALYYAFESDEELGGVYAVYDLGGGTFDVSIINLSGQEVELLSTDGVSRLGGDDFDEALRKLVTAKYVEAAGGELDPADFTKNDAEGTKISLSTHNEVTTRVRSDAGKAMITITRHEFEEAISSLIAQTEMLCETAMSDADVSPSDIKGVFLAGGSTRIPAVMESIKRVFQQEPMKSGNVDEVVALGASLYAAYKAGQSELSEFQKQAVAKISIAEITTYCFGLIQPVKCEEGGEEQLQNVILIDKGEKAPCSMTAVLKTTGNGQDRIHIRLTQSKAPEKDSRFVKIVWEDVVELDRAYPKGVEALEVTLSYNENGIMRCLFLDTASGKKTEVDLNLAAASWSADDRIDQFTVE